MKKYKYVARYLTRSSIHQKIHPLRDAAFNADRRDSLKIFNNRNSKSKEGIVVILSITVTCCTNIHILKKP